MSQARVLKRKYIEYEHYEEAAYQREIELKCKQYEAMKTKYRIGESTFHLDQNHLYYFHFGTSKNDHEAEKCFQEFITIIGKQKDVTYLPFISEVE